VSAADLALVITTPDVVANRDADRAIGILENIGVPNVMLIINKVRGDLVRKGKTLNIDEIIDLLGIDALGIVPDDDCVLTGNEADMWYADKAFDNIARRLEGEAVPLLKLRRKR
jgi:septum site-determining protein MinD